MEISVNKVDNICHSCNVPLMIVSRPVGFLPLAENLVPIILFVLFSIMHFLRDFKLKRLSLVNRTEPSDLKSNFAKVVRLPSILNPDFDMVV